MSIAKRIMEMSKMRGKRFALGQVVNVSQLDQIKRLYIKEVLKEDTIYISQQQEIVVNYWELFETDTLKSSIKKAWRLQDSSIGMKADISYVKYIRFLDMNSNIRLNRDGYHLYNKIIWGVLMNRTVAKIVWGFTEDIKNRIVRDYKLSIDL